MNADPENDLESPLSLPETTDVKTTPLTALQGATLAVRLFGFFMLICFSCEFSYLGIYAQDFLFMNQPYTHHQYSSDYYFYQCMGFGFRLLLNGLLGVVFLMWPAAIGRLLASHLPEG